MVCRTRHRSLQSPRRRISLAPSKAEAEVLLEEGRWCRGLLGAGCCWRRAFSASRKTLDEGFRREVLEILEDGEEEIGEFLGTLEEDEGDFVGPGVDEEAIVRDLVVVVEMEGNLSFGRAGDWELAGWHGDAVEVVEFGAELGCG